MTEDRGQRTEALKRLPRWRSRLAETVAGYRAEPFRSGVTDWAMMAADVVLALTGVDFAADLRGQYSSCEEGEALLKARGFDDPIAFVAAQLPEIPVSATQLGDLVLVERAGIRAVGLCNGATILMHGERGIGPLPRSAASRAWKVG